MNYLSFKMKLPVTLGVISDALGNFTGSSNQYQSSKAQRNILEHTNNA